MADKKKSFLLRIPPDLWEDLNRWARDELRSLNSQIEFILREATRRRTRRPDPAPNDAMPNADQAAGSRPEDAGQD